MRKAETAQTEKGDPETEAMRVYWQALISYFCGNLKNAGERFAAGAAQNRKLHRVVAEQVCLHMNRHVFAYIGGTDEEFAAARHVLALSKEIGNPVGICWGEYDSACALARRGKLSTAVAHLQRAYRALGESRCWMTEPIRDSSGAFVLLQASVYDLSRERAMSALKLVVQGWVMMDCSMFGLPLLLEAIAGPQWSVKADRATAKALKWSMRRAVVCHWLLRNHQPHLFRARGRANWRLGRMRRAVKCFENAIRLAESMGMSYQHAKTLLDLGAVQEKSRAERRSQAIDLLKHCQSVIPRAEAWLLGDQYDEAVVAPEFDLAAWEREHGPISPILEGKVNP